jgi:hypothetical protein
LVPVLSPVEGLVLNGVEGLVPVRARTILYGFDAAPGGES